MLEIEDKDVPVLPGKYMLKGGECVAIGVVSDGVIVQYIERNTTLLILWDDIVRLGFTAFEDDIDGTLPGGVMQIEKPIPAKSGGYA